MHSYGSRMDQRRAIIATDMKFWVPKKAGNFVTPKDPAPWTYIDLIIIKFLSLPVNSYTQLPLRWPKCGFPPSSQYQSTRLLLNVFYHLILRFPSLSSSTMWRLPLALSIPFPVDNTRCRRSKKCSVQKEGHSLQWLDGRPDSAARSEQ